VNLLASRRGRRGLLAALYFAEGAPIGWLWWALPVRLREAGAPIEDVTLLTGSLALPWALKMLWAPAVDGLRTRRWGLRAWAVAAQLGMALALVPLLFGVDLARPATFMPLLVAHAFLAATQDVAIDGLAVRAVPPAERGGANAWMQLGMLAGRGLFGGLSLRAEAWIGFEGVVAALVVASVAPAALLVLAAREPEAARRELGGAGPGGRLLAVLRVLGAALATRRVWAGLAFAALGGAAFEAVGGTAGPLLVDLGVGAERVGLFYALPALLCMGAGALLGGRLADRRPRRRACVLGVLLVVGAVAALALSVRAGVRGDAVLALLGAVYLVLGTLTAASYALFMDLSDPRAGGTLFSAFMGATNLCEAWAVMAAGRLAAHGGGTPGAYADAWLVPCGASLLGLVAIAGARPAPAR